MARVTTQKTTVDRQCEVCGAKIPKGSQYKSTKPFRQRPRVACMDCGSKASFAETDDKKKTIQQAIESAESAIGSASSLEEIAEGLRALYNEAESVKGEYESSAENIPENFAEMRERMESNASSLETWMDELETAASEVEDMQEDYDKAAIREAAEEEKGGEEPCAGIADGCDECTESEGCRRRFKEESEEGCERTTDDVLDEARERASEAISSLELE